METHPGRSLITWQTHAAHSAFILLHFLPNYIAKIIAPLIKHRKPHNSLYGDYVSCCCLAQLYVLSVLSTLHLKLEKHQSHFIVMFCVRVKWIARLNNIYSPSCCSKPVWLFFFCGSRSKKVCFLPHTISQWGPRLFRPFWVWKYHLLHSAEERKSYRFGATWGSENDDSIFVFGRTFYVSRSCGAEHITAVYMANT